jgi:thermostable 8-oxoguanine DNA glycosylase
MSMNQTPTILTRNGAIQVELPAANAMLLPGVSWGAVEAFPSPAYFAFQVIARRLVGRPAQYSLGRTIAEEVGACLLGGHGIPGKVGIAAYEHLRSKGAFRAVVPNQEQLEAWLREPLYVEKRVVRYRFAAQKARYLAQALPMLRSAPSFTVGRHLREWLLDIPGIGPKTASWIARNWLHADDVAILDIHILRVGQLAGLFPKGLTVERHYLQLEELFLNFSAALDVRPSELDAVIWYEMASSPASVRHVLDHLEGRPLKTSRTSAVALKRQEQWQLA